MWTELIIIACLLFVIWYFILRLYSKIKLNKLRRKYNAEEDKSRSGKEFINQRADRTTDIPEPSPKPVDKSEGRGILQNDAAFSSGKNIREPASSSPGDKPNKVKRIRRWFRKPKPEEIEL